MNASAIAYGDWPDADFVQGVPAQLPEAACLSSSMAVVPAFLSIASTNSMAVAPPPLTRWAGCRPSRRWASGGPECSVVVAFSLVPDGANVDSR